MSVFEAIQASYEDLSEAKQRISQCILARWQEVAFWSAGTLAREVGVSESVVVRFAQDIGYSGYRELQQELQAMVRQRLPMAQKLARSGARLGKDAEIIRDTVDNDIANLRSILDATPTHIFSSVAQAVMRARRIYVVGMANSWAMAQLLAGKLNRIVGDTLAVRPESPEGIERIARVGENDLVIGISFPRYMRMTVRALELARAAGTPTVAITDSVLSPLGRAADFVIAVRNQGLSFAESQAATVTVINILVNLVARRSSDPHRGSLQRLEQVFDNLGLVE